MANSLFPAFVRVQYHSEFGVHFKTIPTLAWSESAGVAGQVDTWDAGPTDLDDMVQELLTLEAEFMPTTVNYTSYIVYTMEDETADPLPVAAVNIDIDGTVATPGWHKATQATWSFRTTLGGVAKIIQLDVATLGSFDKIISAGVSPAQDAFIAGFTSPSAGWAGRDGGRPALFQQIAFDLNDKLRAEYRMN